MADLIFAAGFAGAAILSIVIISNPISTSAIFVTLTEEMTREEKMAIVNRTITYSTIILLFFAMTGLLLFQLFGFSIGAFRIAGGVLLFTTAVGMLSPKSISEEAEHTSSDIAIIPLAIPFIAGPGTITTVVVLMSEAENIMIGNDLWTGIICMTGIFAGISVNTLVAYFMMTRSEKIDSYWGEGGRKVVTRLMGLLVMAIAIQFIINGVKDILPEFIRVANETAGMVLAG